MSLLLIRHARTLPDPAVPAEDWVLDPAGQPELDELRERLAGRQLWWYSSDEPKALATAAALTSGPVSALPRLREVQRGGWADDYDALVARFFAEPDRPAAAGWETARGAVARFDAAVRGILAQHPAGDDIAVVTHGLVIALWYAHATRRPVDLPAWRVLRFPDLIEVG